MTVKHLSPDEPVATKASRPRRTQAERRAEAEANLLLAAARLIAGQGLSRVSLAQIGEAAGYSRGLVNHHFGSKAVLIERLVEFVQSEFEAATVPWTLCESSLDRILELTSTFLGMLAELSPIHRAFLVLWAEAVVAPPEIQNAMAQSDRGFRSAIAEVIEAGIRAGTIRNDVSPRGFATCLVGQLRGVALQVLIDPEATDLAETRSEMERGLRRSLTGGDRLAEKIPGE